MMMHNRVLKIGLTGGIGSGKSTVGHMLAKRGAFIIDADAIARSLTEPNGSAIPMIAEIFGGEFINTQGALDRERMRSHVFTDAAAKKALETIIHPLVTQETAHQAQIAISQGQSTLVFDVPLLVESGARWRTQVDCILVIDCTVETQMQRVMARSQLSRETVEQIIASQASRDQRLHAADWVIYNEHVPLDTLWDLTSNLPLQP
jgi:dephospho-CoA kinase